MTSRKTVGKFLIFVALIKEGKKVDAGEELFDLLNMNDNPKNYKKDDQGQEGIRLLDKQIKALAG